MFYRHVPVPRYPRETWPVTASGRLRPQVIPDSLSAHTHTFFHGKEALYGFSLVCANGRPHCPRIWEAVRNSKGDVVTTCHPVTVGAMSGVSRNQQAGSVRTAQMPDGQMSRSWTGRGGAARGFATPLTRAHDSTLNELCVWGIFHSLFQDHG